jgi:Fe-S cluster biogenesis protein NfuA
MSNVTVFYEATPNPQALRFVVTETIAAESLNFTSALDTGRSPLAQKLFGFPWAAGVFIGPNFVTVTKQEWVEWDIIADPLAELIREHIASGLPVLTQGPQAMDDLPANQDSPGDSPTVRQIKRILREEISPAVAMDGGQIRFDRYEDGRVYLKMQGACSGCPSSAYTLKEGIESRLKERITEVQEVVAV